MSIPRLRLDAIQRATTRIAPEFLNSPQFVSEALSDTLGLETLVKMELMNPIRSFKGRGADFYVQELENTEQRLVCASAGNFGQGMAYATRRRGWTIDVFASVHANPLKVERMQRLGATVHRAGHDFDAAKDAAHDFAVSCGGVFVEDGRIREISEGAGTIGVELLAASRPPAVVVVPLGNGALLGGVATWIKAHAPDVEIIGVCAAAAPAMEQSWRSRSVRQTPSAETISDGIAVRVPIPEALDDLRHTIDDIVLVDDAQTVAAMQLAMKHLGALVEPAGAVGLAALMVHRERWSGRGPVATVLCGGNVTDAQRAQWGV